LILPAVFSHLFLIRLCLRQRQDITVLQQCRHLCYPLGSFRTNRVPWSRSINRRRLTSIWQTLAGLPMLGIIKKMALSDGSLLVPSRWEAFRRVILMVHLLHFLLRLPSGLMLTARQCFPVGYNMMFSTLLPPNSTADSVIVLRITSTHLETIKMVITKRCSIK